MEVQFNYELSIGQIVTVGSVIGSTLLSAIGAAIDRRAKAIAVKRIMQREISELRRRVDDLENTVRQQPQRTESAKRLAPKLELKDFERERISPPD